MTERLFVQPDGVLTQVVDNEMVLMDVRSERYFALDDVGLRFWHVLLDTQTLDEAIATLAAEYEVDQAKLERDLRKFVNTLEAKGLLQQAGSG